MTTERGVLTVRAERCSTSQEWRGLQAMSVPLVHRRRERGIALIHAIFVLGALVAMTAVGVDLGHMVFTATEVQTAAEVAATAGATSMLKKEDGGAESGAILALQENYIDGKTANNNLDSIEEGNFASGTFAPGGTPSNAVRAQTSATVNNLFAGLSGWGFSMAPTSTVTKRATASYTSLGEGQPTLPIAIGQCSFPDRACLEDACLPSLTQVPAPSNNTAWTAFDQNNAGKTEIESFLPSPCGSGAEVPILTADDDAINLNGGQTSVLKAIECLFNEGLAQYGRTEFLVPVIGSCDGNLSGWYPVVGFATIVIDSITTTGNPKGMDLHAIFNASAPGKPGGGGFGTGFVMLVG